MMQKHQKHAKLARPDLGNFARREFAILGAPCGVIQSLAANLVGVLGEHGKIAYLDADHGAGDESPPALLAENCMVYTDKINWHRFDIRQQITPFQQRQWFCEQDLVLVNGNHFTARRQLLILDPRKFESLAKKLDRLTDVAGFIKTADDQEIPDFLKAHLPQWQTLPVWQPGQSGEIAGYLKEAIRESIPAVNGLILAGGKSTRMGQDKGQLSYHGLPQREYLYRLAESIGLPAYLSCRPDQVEEMPAGHRLLPDSFLGLGPYGAILSALQHDPNGAWLVIACDLPFVDEAGLRYLLAQRDPSSIATAFLNPATGFPDPLLTLWEPKAYPVLLQFLAQGHSCPRKVLINSATRTAPAPNDRILTNVNVPADLEKAKGLLGKMS